MPVEPLAWLETLPHAAFLRRSVTAYLLVNASHILGIGLLVGAIVPLDFRLMGVLRSGSLAELAPFLVRVAATGLALALLTGAMLFSVKPQEYLGNPAFLVKLGLLLLGLITAVVQHRSTGWSRLRQGGDPGVAPRLLAGLSCTIWLSALVAGRWIGFV